MDILVIDDHPLIVQAITSVIDTLRCQAVVHSLDSVEAIDAAGLHFSPQLVLLDLALPGVSGLFALRAVRQRFPQSSIVIFSATQDSDTIASALRAGARGFIPKTSRYRDLADALRLVLDGGTYVPPGVLDPVEAARPFAAGNPPPGYSHQMAAPRDSGLPVEDDSGPTGNPSDLLTERQRQIVGLFADGLSTKEISRRLGISTNTVKSHIAVIFRTLGVSNRAQVVAITHSRPSVARLQ